MISIGILVTVKTHQYLQHQPQLQLLTLHQEKTSITIPSKLPSLWIPLRNGNIDYSRYYNTNQEEDNQEQQLQDGNHYLLQPPIMVQQRLQQPMPILYKTPFETIPCFSSTTNTTITSSRSNPTNSTPTSNDPSFPKQMINWNQFYKRKKT